MAAPLLTLVASLLVGHAVPVHCHHPPGEPWGDAVGITTYWPAEVWLKDCAGARRLESWPLEVYAHELIHVEHPGWAERRVRRWDGWYARAVVGPAIRRALKR